MKSGKSFSEFIKSGKNNISIAVILTVGLLLILLSGFFDREEAVSDTGVEARVAEMCSSVAGVGDCKVMVTYKDESCEEVLGVAVLCEGADSPAVKERVIELVGSLFGIGSHRITVLKITE